METLEKSRMCRLCGKQSGIAVDIFDKNESHVRKINAILPILVHEMDLLPKQMCHRCSYKLEEFYNFYVDCAKTDRELKSQLSWMSKEDVGEKVAMPMVKMTKFKVKTEPLDNDSINSNNAKQKLSESSLFFPASILQHGPEPDLTLPCLQCKCVCNRSVKVNQISSKQIKAPTKSESENQAHNSQIIFNNPSVLIEQMDMDDKIKYADKLFKRNTYTDTKPQDIITNNFDNDVFIKLDDHSSAIKSENSNRALRPRRSSVDYVGPKKKVTLTNLKVNVKNKFDNLDLSLVNPIDVRITQGNTNHPTPIIKLEKVDDVKSLRVQQNLELFNRRVKELQRKKNLQKNENRCRKNLWIEGNRSRKSEQLEESQNNSSKNKSQKDENRCKRNLTKEDNDVKSESQLEENKHQIHLTVNDSNNDLNIVESKIKQEPLNKVIKLDASSERPTPAIPMQPVNRLPLCAVVKLEDDYTCNLNYPKIQIKRPSIATNPQKSEEGGSKTSTKKIDLNSVTNKKLFTENDTFLKNLRSNERKLEVKNNHHETRSSKNSSKKLNFNTDLKKEPSIVLNQNEFKCYCEECDTSFRNKELYRLHPCYQK